MMITIVWTLAAVAVLCAAVAVNGWEQQAKKSPGPKAKKMDHGCPGCGAPGMMHQKCDHCGRVNE